MASCSEVNNPIQLKAYILETGPTWNQVKVYLAGVGIGVAFLSFFVIFVGYRHLTKPKFVKKIWVLICLGLLVRAAQESLDIIFNRTADPAARASLKKWID